MSHAYVPEHVVGLITSLSAGEPFLIDDYFCCCRDDWLIFIGYPLSGCFDPDHLETVLEKILIRFKPRRISLIAPAVPRRYVSNCREKDSDSYYTLEVQNPIICSAVKRNLKKASQRLSVEWAVQMAKAHQELMQEFARNAALPARIRDLFLKMPRYVEAAPECFVLNAWSSKDVLAAFYVIDFTAAKFANYIIGCYSKQNYVLGASDLLLMELIKASQRKGKSYVHLGLGVNDGIRRFKEKWGAKPSRKYEMCELILKKSLFKKAVRALMESALSSS